ncbi:uncharacterized protein LOC136084216 [Hydra vulgaris]|uniref:Uncharacterized protein LOC136084216 n=1 Tax=Hydra vulgaris TaxID=6087 RepID=A0ABM4CFB9_HYDVU
MTAFLLKVLIQWPYLVQIEYLLDHFATLMNFPLMERLYSTISSKSRLIYYFFSNQCSKDLVKQVLLEVTVIGMGNGGIWRVCLAWVPLLIAYFGDKADHLILSVNELGLIQKIFMFWWKRKWKESYTFTDALQAVGALFAVHYVMNMQYHPYVFATLQFNQRHMVDYNPEKVKRNAKGKKKRTLVCPRIVTSNSRIK